MTPKESMTALWKLEKRQSAYAEKIRKERQRIMSECAHDWTYHPDPSGNNDSGYCCNGCGKWVRRLP